jgi:hypothetical protein
MADLRKEVWVKQLMEKFYPDSSFLKYVKDFSALVENHALNLAEAGVDPDVLINNTAYPIAVVKRADTPIRVELDQFETINTLVRRPEVIEYAYNQLESVLMGHRNILRAKTAEKAAHAFAPDEDTANTPIVLTSGSTHGNRQRMTFEDILNLKERFDNNNIPFENRYLVLHPSHLTDLIMLDVKAFKDITDIVNGEPKRFAGFGILQFSKPAYYDSDTLKKNAYGSVLGADDVFCSFAFNSQEVMKADGEVHMYDRQNDPEQRGTIYGVKNKLYIFHSNKNSPK